MGCPTIPADECEDRNSDWFEYITSPWIKLNPSLFMKGDPTSLGPGFYETYRDDLSRARNELGSNAIRISLEWSRLFPVATTGVSAYEDLRQMASPSALEYYHNLISAIRAQGMVPFVTLNHYTLPQWIHSAVDCHVHLLHCKHRGWVDPAVIVPEIAKYAGFVAREFGQDVDYWMTLNEPFSAVVLPSYLLPTPERTNPPGLYLQIEAAKIANATMIESHAKMYEAIKSGDTVSSVPGAKPAEVGIAYSFFAIRPASNRPIDLRVAANLKYLMHDQFLDALTYGRFDPDWSGQTTVRPDLAGHLDFIGVNYYVRLTPPKFSLGSAVSITDLLLANPIDAIFDRDAPDGLTQVLVEQSHYGLPLYVTETGTDASSDTERPRRWLRGTLAATHAAIDRGVDVRGYFYWSLMDNYEWNHGMDSRFGLFSIDPNDKNKTRVPRSAVNAFREISMAREWPE
jgi:beta-glucosidase/6-phospho-beta-glucosidase/beta-galactosidase